MKSILNVNDQPALRKMTSRILSGAGYSVQEASSGEEAIEMSLAQTPDLVLLDVRMQGISGFEVCRLLKDDPKTSEIPIVIMSGHHVGEIDKQKGRALGVNNYLTLPLDKEALLGKLRELIG